MEGHSAREQNDLFCKNNRKKFGKQHFAQKYMPFYVFDNENFGNKHENLKNK